MTDNVIDNLVVGGPAYNTQSLQKGDSIVSVDGVEVEEEELPAAIIGSDEPGSIVTLRVRRHLDGEEQEVDVVRIESRELADKRRLFELFTAMENHIDDPESCSRTDALKTVDKAITLWTNMEHKVAEKLRGWEERQRGWEERERHRVIAMRGR
jgi:hypothetical protein